MTKITNDYKTESREQENIFVESTFSRPRSMTESEDNQFDKSEEESICNDRDIKEPENDEEENTSKIEGEDEFGKDEEKSTFISEDIDQQSDNDEEKKSPKLSPSCSSNSSEHSLHERFDQLYESIPHHFNLNESTINKFKGFKPVLYEKQHADLKYKGMLVREQTLQYERNMRREFRTKKIKAGDWEMIRYAKTMCYYPGDCRKMMSLNNSADLTYYSPGKIQVSPTNSEVKAMDLGYFYSDLPREDFPFRSSEFGISSSPMSGSQFSSLPIGASSPHFRTPNEKKETVTLLEEQNRRFSTPKFKTSERIISKLVRTPGFMLPGFKTPERRKETKKLMCAEFGNIELKTPERRKEENSFSHSLLIEKQLSPAIEQLMVSERRKLTTPKSLQSFSSDYTDAYKEDSGTFYPFLRVSTPTNRIQEMPSNIVNVSLRKKCNNHKKNQHGKKTIVHFVKLGRVYKVEKQLLISHAENISVKPLMKERCKSTSPLRLDTSSERSATTNAVQLSPPLSTRQESIERKIVLLVRNDVYLGNEELMSEFLSKFDSEVCSTFKVDVTHVLAASETISDVKFEFVQAIGYKKFLVSLDWLTSSTLKGHLADERIYEVKFDVAPGSAPVFPARIARAIGWGLLKGFAFLLAGPFRGCQPQQMEDLLKSNGAIVTPNPEELSQCTNLTKVCVVGSKLFFNEEKNTKILLNRLRNCKCIRVRYAWILKCFARYEIIPMTPYLFEMTYENAIFAGLLPE